MGGLFLTGAEGSRNDDVPDCSWRGLHFESEGDLQRRSGPWVHTGAESTEDCGVLFWRGGINRQGRNSSVGNLAGGAEKRGTIVSKFP
jgi:hypothetical protein